MFADFHVYGQEHGQERDLLVIKCWVINPDHLDDPDLWKFDECADPNEIISESEFASWPKWKTLIKPYMQDSD
jgi:hypothetical protein